MFQKFCTLHYASCTSVPSGFNLFNRFNSFNFFNHLTCKSLRDMLYIQGVNQPKLTTGRQPVTSLGKGNPMKDHARHVPGSTPSRRTALSRSVPFFLGSLLSPVCPKNPYKTRTNPTIFSKCKFFNYYPSTTYNFNALKCTDFLATARFPLPRGEGQGEGQTGSWLWRARRCHAFSLGAAETKSLGRSKYWFFPLLSSRVNLLTNNCTESANAPIYYRFDPVAPTTYAKQNRRAPIFVDFWRGELRRVPNSVQHSRPFVEFVSAPGSTQNRIDFRGVFLCAPCTHHHPLCSLTT